jgi:uncharacterized protein YbaP (TraB family)
MKKQNRLGCERLRVHWGLALLILLISVALTLQTQRAYSADVGRHFLWSIQKNNKTIHVMGSIHLLKPGYAQLPEALANAYERSDCIVFETDIGSIQSPEVQSKMLSLGIYPEGETLKANISTETHDLLTKKAAALGLPKVSLEGFRPWLCALTLTVMELHKLGFSAQHGLDKYFFDKSTRDGKKIMTLESVDYQIGIFAQMDEKRQEAFLNQSLKDLEVVESMAQEMVQAWEHGDTDKMNSVMQMSLEDHPDLYDILFAQRNSRWASKIESIAEEYDQLLVIVGAGHLVGEKNLLDLFREKGYSVEQQ